MERFLAYYENFFVVLKLQDGMTCLTKFGTSYLADFR